MYTLSCEVFRYMMILTKVDCGRFFLVMSIIFGCLNDVLSKCMIDHMASEEIVFFRFLVGAVVLIPFMKGSDYIKLIQEKNSIINCIRGILGVISMWLCTYSLVYLKLVEITILMWTVPLFELFLCRIFFADKASGVQILSTMICFACIVLFSLNSISLHHYQYIVFPLLAAILFAIQDIIIKKIGINAKQDIHMLFFFSIVAALCASCFVSYYSLLQISGRDICFLILLGICTDLTQYFLFVAFRTSNLSSLVLVKYLEFSIQIIFGFLFFSEVPSVANLICATILILLITMGNKNKKPWHQILA